MNLKNINKDITKNFDILDKLPYEISFINADFEYEYFNNNYIEKIFTKDSKLGEKFYAHQVMKMQKFFINIVFQLKSGKKERAGIWLKSQGKTLFVHYIAIIDDDGRFLGSLEIVEDMDFAQKYFKKIYTSKEL